MGGLGPMAGQYNHFGNYAPEKLPYAIDRYRNEVNRLFGVMNKRLADRDYLGGDYSIADMASYPWVVPWERQGQNIADFPHLKRWLEAIKARPRRGQASLRKAPEINPNPGGIRTAEERAILFGQTAQSVERTAHGDSAMRQSLARKYLRAAGARLLEFCRICRTERVISVLPHDDARADRHAVVEVDHVVVDQAEAAGRDRVADRLRRVGAVDAVDRLAEIHGAGAERIAGSAGHEARQIGLALDHLRRRMPVRPFGLAGDLQQAGQVKPSRPTPMP